MIAENQNENVAEMVAEVQTEQQKTEEKYVQLKKLLESVELAKYFEILRKEEITIDILGISLELIFSGLIV